jgi:hypothetical protein
MDISTNNWSAFTFLPIVFILLYVISFGVGIYCVVLFIKFARRAIKALDIYLEEKHK